MQPFASLCLLSYKRLDALISCLDSLLATIDYPCEIIVNEDAGSVNTDLLIEYHKQGKISKLILVNGKNRGVGNAFANCLGVAEGDFIFKLDTDLIFKKGWLSSAVSALTNYPDIGGVGLFDYHRQDPHDSRFTKENNIIETRGDVTIVKDFVSCGYGFRKADLNKILPVEDDGNHTKLGKLTLLDVVDNKSFGFGSVYVQIDPNGVATKTPTHNQPLLF